jgi:hypothetical protein
MNTLKKADKVQIIESRIRAVESKKYSLEIDLMVESNRNEPLEVALVCSKSRIRPGKPIRRIGKYAELRISCCCSSRKIRATCSQL